MVPSEEAPLFTKTSESANSRENFRRDFFGIPWNSLEELFVLSTMTTVQDPCIDFAYVYAVPKYFDVPSTGFHNNTV